MTLMDVLIICLALVGCFLGVKLFIVVAKVLIAILAFIFSIVMTVILLIVSGVIWLADKVKKWLGK